MSPPVSQKGQLRFLIIGAGARGNSYAKALVQSTPDALISAVAEPVDFKRQTFGRKYIWDHDSHPSLDQSFADWRDFGHYEVERRRREKNLETVQPGVDGIFVCTLDETHAEIITSLAPLGISIMSEKPLATTLADCLRIYQSLLPAGTVSRPQIFSIGHVLHYSPHNMLLRKLLLEDEAVGEILSMEHTEPVGWWHFAHSYVRGNWRKESTTAPSLLTKSCHDIDLLLWLLCFPPASAPQRTHLPSHVTSTGALTYFKRSRKPPAAGEATNCLDCQAEPDCLYSARKIYEDDRLAKGNAAWPVHVIDPEIEDMYNRGQKNAAETRLRERLAEDYDASTPGADRRPWYGRCVYEANNDVCDDQIVTMEWEDDPVAPEQHTKGRGAKHAIFHMVAWTEKQCDRRGRIYGTNGEIEYDSEQIRVYNFGTKTAQVHHPPRGSGGHGGGDAGLAVAFFRAIQAVKSGEMTAAHAQQEHIGCTLDDIVRGHVMVFAAEEARTTRTVVNWADWWKARVEKAIPKRDSEWG